MKVVEAKRIETFNLTETLRQMPINSILKCTIEEKDIFTSRAIRLKRKEGKEYTFRKDPVTKIYTITRLK